VKLPAVTILVAVALSSFFSSTAVADDRTPAPSCSDKLGKLDDKTKVAFATQAFAPPESMLAMKITGKGVVKGSEVALCYKLANGDLLASEKFVEFNRSAALSDDTSVQGELSILPNALKGDYEIRISTNDPDDKTKKKWFDTDLVFTVRSPNNGQYADCPKDGGPVAGNEKLLAEMIWPHFFAIQLILLLLIIMYCTGHEMVRVIGKERAVRIFFGPMPLPQL